MRSAREFYVKSLETMTWYDMIGKYNGEIKDTYLLEKNQKIFGNHIIAKYTQIRSSRQISFSVFFVR